MQVTCPDCGSEFPIAAGFLDAEGKRLAALFGELEPVVARAAVLYLRLFAPPKQRLRLARAVRIVEQLVSLVAEGQVAADERTGVRRAATPAMWAQGMDRMLADESLVRACRASPMANHNYLRKVVFGLADDADAAAEREREEQVRRGRPAPAPAAVAAPQAPRQPRPEPERLKDHLAALEAALRSRAAAADATGDTTPDAPQTEATS